MLLLHYIQRVSHGNKLTIKIKRITEFIFKLWRTKNATENASTWSRYFRIVIVIVFSLSRSFDFSIQFEQLIVWAVMLLPYFLASIIRAWKKSEMKRREKTTKEKQNNKFNVNIEINRTGAKLDTCKALKIDIRRKHKNKWKELYRCCAHTHTNVGPKNRSPFVGLFSCTGILLHLPSHSQNPPEFIEFFRCIIFSQKDVRFQFILYANWCCDLQCHL